MFFRFFSKAKNWGCIVVKFADENQVHYFGDVKSERKVQLTIKNPRAFLWRVVTSADVGFAEAFMAGDFDCTDLTTLFQIFIANRDYMNGLDSKSAWVGHTLNRISHMRRANTIEGSKKNIEQHYDLGNEMFNLFLDSTMTYSCAVWNNPKETLEQAQINKIRKVIQKANIQATDHVLEIGSGWGSFAMEAVRLTGCRVTTITLSSQQKELAEQRIREAKMDDRIQVLLMDYRLVRGQYDKIVSIEMLEAVGHDHYPTYFETCYRLLKPNGKFVFQVITMPHKNYDIFRKDCDFLQKYIFPGGLLPSINILMDVIEKHTKFSVISMENIGIHYVRTLQEWRTAFMRNKSQILAAGFDDVFIRKWEYYFCYCEAGFKTRYVSDYQIELTNESF
jgi:cyclopropane-fatty-acyl-phospholipid synthase